MQMFTKKIVTSIGIKQFVFRQLERTDKGECIVNVIMEYTNPIMFEMSKGESDVWVLSPQRLPDWIRSIETGLNDAIEEQAIYLETATL